LVESGENLGSELVFFGDLEKMGELDGGCKEDGVELVAGEAVGGFEERGGVFGQGPLVDADGSDLSAALAEGVEKVRVGLAVFLDGDAVFGALGGGGEEFAPGVWAGNVNVPGDAPFAENGLRLGAAWGDGEAFEFGGEGAGSVVWGENGVDGAGADAGEEDDHVELAGLEAAVEIQDIGIVGDGNFAHGGSDEGLSALFAKQRGDFFAATGFERENAESGKAHIRL